MSKEQLRNMFRQKDKSGVQMGLKGKLLAGILIPTVVILLLLSIILQNRIGSIVGGMQNNNISSQAQSAGLQVNDYFNTIFLSEKMIQNLDSVERIFTEADAAGPSFRFQNSANYQRLVNELSRSRQIQGDSVQLIWIASFLNNQVIQSDGGVSDPATLSVVDRPWYQRLKDERAPVLTGAYVDSVSGKLVVSAISPILDGKNNLIGAVGIDIDLDGINTILSQIKIGETGYLTVYDSDGNIIFHPNSDLILKNTKEIDYSENMKAALASHENSEIMKYKRDTDTMIGKVSYLDQIDWTVLACITESEYTQEQKQISFITTVGFLLCILCLVFICISIANKMLKPVKLLTDVAPNLMEGKLNMELPEPSKDEIGTLIEIFGTTAQGLEEIIVDISNTLESIADKDLTVETQAKYNGEFMRIRQAIYHIISGMDVVMGAVIRSADQVSAGSDQVAFGAQALAQGATEQAASVEKLSSAISGVTEQIQKMSRNAQQASDEAKIVGDNMTLSGTKMDEMQKSMARINQASGEIEKIVKTIEDIAFQTNILALNAAVEAARAGNAGKGFAVVADEVRNLASKSAEASQTTTSLIANSLTAVREGMRLADETAQVLTTAVQGASNVVQQIQFVSQDLALQSGSMDEIASGVEQISSVVQTNSATAEESAAASEELAAQAQTLKNMVADFKLRNTSQDGYLQDF